MEILIVVAIMSVVVKRGVEDIIHTAKGGTPPRYAAASARRKSGAAGRYWGQLWDDTWDDLLKRHVEKRDRRNTAPRPVRDPSQMRTVFTQFGDDFGNWARATWRYGWNKHEARRQAKRLRDSAGRQTVPGTVVPNAEDGARPQDRPVPEPSSVPDQDDAPVPPTWDDEIVPSPPDLKDEDQSGPDSVPDYVPDLDPSPATPNTEGPTTMTTIPTGEVTSLSQTIRFCEDSAQAYRAQVHAIEQTQATLSAEEVSGPAADAFAQAMEQSHSAANSMEAAAAEFRKHLVVQEAYDSVQGAGTKKFVTAGR